MIYIAILGYLSGGSTFGPEKIHDILDQSWMGSDNELEDISSDSEHITNTHIFSISPNINNVVFCFRSSNYFIIYRQCRPNLIDILTTNPTYMPGHGLLESRSMF